MKKKKPIITYEFGNLCLEGQICKEGDTPLSEVSFNNLWDFILSNDTPEDADVIMSVHKKGKRRYIKTGRYVGTIQTKDGQIIEVLPKIYNKSGGQEKDKNLCRKVFLNMLKHFTDAKARSFQKASLNTKKGFPILEVYISNYIDAVEQLMLGGVKKNYAIVEENQVFLKGKLDITKHITKNVANKARFAIKYNKYIENIPHNRLVVSTLYKLMETSSNTTNRGRIANLLALLSDIPQSKNVEGDLRIASSNNRLFSSYDLLIKWSSQFLLNRGFTTFSGDCVNQSLLFQAEKLFEDFIAYLFRKYAPTYNVHPQNQKYFLVDKHNGKGMFKLIPDIVVETRENSLNYECIIIDTKWKAIDSTRPDKQYLLSMKDLYQLYAYGQKYKLGQSEEVGEEVIPKLVLLYPYSEKFTEQLPEFIYDEIKEQIGLKLMVVPFNLSEPVAYEKQIHSIMDSLVVENNEQPIYRFKYDIENATIPLVAEDEMPSYRRTKRMLVGCYKDERQLEWIMQNNLYNIRMGNRNGAIDKSGMIVSASRLLLYNSHNPKEYKVYALDPAIQIFANHELMEIKGYPGLKKNRNYLLYSILEEIENHPEYDVAKLKEQYAPEIEKKAPFFVVE